MEKAMGTVITLDEKTFYRDMEKNIAPGELDGELYITTDAKNKTLIVSAFGEDTVLRLNKKRAQWLAQMLINHSQML